MLCDTCIRITVTRPFILTIGKQVENDQLDSNESISRAFLFAFDQIKQILNDLTFDLIRSKNNGEST